MKRFIRNIIVALSAVMLNVPAFAQEPANFGQGVENYTAGNYKEALQVWLDIYNTGYRSANLNYNIGNAYFKLNDIPHAILFFERAYLLDPSDENINYNLEISRSMTVDRFEEIPELFFVKWFNYISLLLHGNTWSIMSLSAFILCLAFLSLYLYTSLYKMKVTGFWLAVTFFLISAVTITFAWQNRTLVHDSHQAIITIPQVSGKSSPDNSGTDLFVIHEGTKVSVGEKLGEWFEITLSDGNKGWIPADAINII